MARITYLFPTLRRPLALGILAATMLFSLAACGSNTDSNSGSAAVSATATVAPAGDMATMPADTAAGAGTAATPATTPAPAGGQTAANAVEVKATLREWGLDLSQTEVAAGPVHFTVTNTGRMPHNLTIKDANGVVGNTPTFSPDQGAQTLDVTLKAGTYTVYCSLPGHADRGQKNTLVVK